MYFCTYWSKNNYGLHWTSFEIEAVPGEENNARAEHLYTLLGEAVHFASIDKQGPVSLTNGDLQYIDLIANTVKTSTSWAQMSIAGHRCATSTIESRRHSNDRSCSVSLARTYNAKDDREDHRMQPICCFSSGRKFTNTRRSRTEWHHRRFVFEVRRLVK